MYKRLVCFLCISLFAPVFAAGSALHDAFNSQQAYAYTAQVAGFGERWPGSLGHQKTEDLIHQVLQKDGAQIEADDFTARTPRGSVPVHNIIGKFNVTADPNQPIFILAGHYDTLFKKGFIGANDGASSTAILLSFADSLAHRQTKMQIWLVWTDLEEAIQSFTNGDGLYGSTHLARKLAAEGFVPRIRGFFLLDMIGDKDLNVARETNSSEALQRIIYRAADQLGYGNYFFQYDANIIDDHAPFLQVGIPAVDVVDAEYGPIGPQYDGMGEYHHTNLDTMDKVSQHSLEIVGRTILLTIEFIDAQS
ncbi:MAG TPA: M28 family peptidase [Candidatus Acidoferrales bacterium]|nr:M28 family peptidase [Candidatus Acidoferrales bacterium]